MIEKIMKAVKSSNKKRSRNITIGAVIGFLLSCTAVMGVTEDNYLWIKDDNGEIKFSTNGREWNNENPYSENSWNTTTNTYTNNITLSGKGNGVSGANYGLKLGTITNLNSEFKFINNGVISGTGSGNSACGILYNGQGKIEAITNKGEISGKSSTRNSDSGYGINISSEERETVRKIGTLNNIGKIYGESTSNDGYGIYISNQTGEITTINNTGIISGKSTGKRNSGYGIYIYGSSGEITTINNTGIISGKSTSNDGYGICNSRGTIGTINNTGVIYGKSWAINNSSGAINKVNNYGILVSCGSSTINGVNNKNNKGLIFGVTSAGTYTATDYDHFGQTYDVEETINSITKKYKVINAKAEGTENNITGTESLKLKNGTLTNGGSPTIDISSDERYILNGITNTLEVSGKNNELNDSVINAYKTAVVMGSNDSTLILNNTVVNGGLSGNDPTISITGNKNILTIQGNSVVNGEMKSIGENNTLNLYGKINNNLNKSNNRYEATSMNILNDISGFTNINIDNNVTFFEDVKVTGTEKVTVAETGTLNLRLKNTGSEETVDGKPIPKATHAFSGNENEMVIQGEGNGENTAGTLNFITNGIGKKIYVDMGNVELRNLYFKTNSIIDKYEFIGTEAEVEGIIIGAGETLNGIYRPENTGKGSQDSNRYESLNDIYKGLYSSTDDNLNALRVLISSNEKLGNNYDENLNDEEQLKNLLSYLGSIYTETPYSFSSELSRKSAGMFRDIVTENQFRPDLNRWLVMGGLTHRDGGTKDSYYGQNYHEIDGGTADVDVDMKLTGAYALGKYGYSENVSLGVTAGGNRSEAKLPMSKVKGNSGYIGAFAENYRGNLTLKAGAGIQYSEYDANRATLGGHSYSDKYSDMAYDIYLNGRYSNPMGDNFFLEPYGTLSYTYVDQESTDEGNKALAIETDSKSFDYTAVKVGVDIKKVIPHEKGKSTLSAGVSYTRLFNGADEENITGRFKGEDATDFDILVAHKNEHSIGLNAKYALELENGILFDVKGSYSVERDSHNGSGKNRSKGEWIAGTGLGYKF
ncbi:autotransporter family protein [Fusobacterium varium]